MYIVKFGITYNGVRANVFNSNEYYYVKSLIKIYSLYVIVAFSYTFYFLLANK